MNQHAFGSSRRETLKSAAAFMILLAGLARGYAANEELNLGILGQAGIGGVKAKAFHSLGENVAALCDIDFRVLDKPGIEYPSARNYSDSQKMFEKRKLDGLILTVPSRNHAYVGVFAMKHGRHVYC